MLPHRARRPLFHLSDISGLKRVHPAVLGAAVTDRLKEIARFPQHGLDAGAVGVIEGERWGAVTVLRRLWGGRGRLPLYWQAAR